MRGTPAIYFKSINGFFHVCGVEKSLFFLIFGLTSTIAVSSHFNLFMDIASIILLAIGHAIGIILTRLDEQILPIYKRHIQYRKYYAPIAGVSATIKLIKPSVPTYEGKRGLV